VSIQKGFPLDEGSIVVERWLQEERWLHLLEGVHKLLCERPLTARGTFRLFFCRGSVSGDGRRNDGRKDSGNYREGQRITMKNGTEGRFISRSEHGDGLLYCR
jgi:hypothetical protein